jgi:hypothetical protein
MVIAVSAGIGGRFPANFAGFFRPESLFPVWHGPCDIRVPSGTDDPNPDRQNHLHTGDSIMTRSIILAAALALGVTLMGASTASAGGGHHHGGHHHGHYYGHHHGGFYGGVIVRPQVYSYPYNYGYGYPAYGYPSYGYGYPSGIGYSNRNFSLWLGR